MYIVLCTAPTEPVHIVPPPNVRAMGELPVLPKYAIVSLVKWMEKNGYTAEEYDFYDIDMLLPSQDEIREYFRKTKPDVVGLSAVTSGTYGQIKRLARTIRSVCPDAMIVLGGNLSASANVVLRKTDVDVCVVGDGEVAWVKLLDYAKQHGRTLAVEALSAIKGLSFLNAAGDLLFTGYGEKVPPSDLCLVPDYDLLKKGLQDRPELLSNYFRPGQGSGWFNHDPRAYESGRKPNIAVLVVNKGCVAKCTFCQRPTKGYRVGNMAELEEHVVYLKENHDVGFITLADENFGSDREAGIEFARIMKKHDMLWTAGGVRVDSMTRELVRTYAENNCVGMKFGVESGSQKILDIMEKKFTVGDVAQAIKWCAEFKILAPLSIMLAMPGETCETVRETSKFIAKLAYDIGKDPFTVFGGDMFYAIPFPGTPLYEYGQQLGIIGSGVDEEEAYLEGLFTAPTYKMSYVNLNGSDVKEVLFWELMVQILVRKEYARLLSSSPRAVEPPASPASQEVAPAVPRPARGARFSPFWAAVVRRIKTRNFAMPCLPWISNFIWRTVIGRKHFLDVSERILFPALQLFLYVEYLILRFCAITRNKDYYQYMSPVLSKDRKLGDNYQDQYPQRKLVSLRNIVITNRKPSQDTTEQNRVKLLIGL
jgi:radical SAM superfamily enzyme YgiQ (UPF0313 family)